MSSSNEDVSRSTADAEANMEPQSVPVNVYETSGALVVVAPLPAVTAQDVQVELHPGDPPCLRFWAHVRSSGTREYLLREWEYGGYERQVELPTGYGAGLEATLRNGQLAIRVLRGEATDRTNITPSG
jgi:HSP20 family molecular chaperone IbpA